jgi:hypothetical protein
VALTWRSLRGCAGRRVVRWAGPEATFLRITVPNRLGCRYRVRRSRRPACPKARGAATFEGGRGCGGDTWAPHRAYGPLQGSAAGARCRRCRGARRMCRVVAGQRGGAGDQARGGAARRVRRCRGIRVRPHLRRHPAGRRGRCRSARRARSGDRFRPRHSPRHRRCRHSAGTHGGDRRAAGTRHRRGLPHAGACCGMRGRGNRIAARSGGEPRCSAVLAGRGPDPSRIMPSGGAVRGADGPPRRGPA